MNTCNEDLTIYINRSKLLYDAYDQIMYRTPLELTRRLCIVYIGEEGIDTGGLLR